MIVTLETISSSYPAVDDSEFFNIMNFQIQPIQSLIVQENHWQKLNFNICNTIQYNTSPRRQSLLWDFNFFLS